MNARTLVTLAAVVLFTQGCATRYIAGTRIEDNSQTRALLELIESYRMAVEGRDPDRLVSLVAPDFRDDGGTPGREDDLSADNLHQALSARFARIDDVSLQIEVRSVTVAKERAEAVYYYTLRFTTPGLTTQQKSQSASELKKMAFRKVDGQWRILGGI
jgi:hypothetical protein